ncbi:MAG: DUF4388 domain-containing protein [Anaerolineae bacterium]|nr:DUF4388 domain-containing protein [Anaerolineae bacterium]
MALKGNLRDFSVAQLLNLINLAAKTGRLVLESNDTTSAQLIFRQGKLAYAQNGMEDNSLAAILYRNQKLSANQTRLIKDKAAQMSDKQLGLLLINAGYVSQEDILASLQNYFLDIVRQVFVWSEGNFQFEAGREPPPDKITVRLDLENLIIEGSRQLKERDRLLEEIPSLEMALKFTDRPGTNVQNLNLSSDEWKVITFVNPRNTMRQIAKATHLSELNLRRAVYGLLQAGVVQIVRPVGAGSVGAGRMFPTNNREEQRSLVNRLINRIRSI